jgi:butyryl-CoA dehydrogenase
MVAAGYLRKCIPAPAGGDNAGLIDMAILAEEFYSVNPSVTLTMLGTVLGLLPILLGGTPDQCKRLLVPFLKTSGSPLAGFCSSEPGGSANAASPPPGEGVRTTANRQGDSWVINGRKKWVSSATGWDRQGANVLCVVCRTDPVAPPDAAISVVAVEGPVTGLVFERAINTIGHRAHLVPQFGFQNVATPRRQMVHRRSKNPGSATGRDRKGADILSLLCRTDPDAPPEQGISVIVVERRAAGPWHQCAIESVDIVRTSRGGSRASRGG